MCTGVPMNLGRSKNCDLMLADETCIQTCEEGYSSLNGDGIISEIYECPSGDWKGTELKCTRKKKKKTHFEKLKYLNLKE